MRIALVTTELPGVSVAPSGGLGYYIQRLALALSDAGHEVEIFVPSEPGADVPAGVRGVPCAWPPIARWASRLTLHRLGMPIDCLVQARMLNRALAVRHAEVPFDVVQYTHLGAVARGRPRGLPAVIRLSGWYPLWHAAGDGAVGGIQGRVVHRMEVAALSCADSIYAPSRHLAGVVSQATGRRIAVLENPFLLECGPAQGAPVVEGRYLLTCGAISRLKGAEVIARSAPAILAAYPDLRWVFAGREAGPGSIAAIRAGLPDGTRRIVHLPHLPHPELYRLMQGAEAVVLPSLVDNLPNTCLEAMALGACVVGTQPTGMEQVIEDGGSGFLAAAGDALHLEQAVHRAMAAGPTGRRSIGVAAQARMQLMRPEVVLSQLIALYACARQAYSLRRSDHGR